MRARDRNLGKMPNDVWLLTGVKRDPEIQPFAIAPPSMPTRVTEVLSRRREKLGHRPAGARVGGADTRGKGMDWCVSFHDQSLASWPTAGTTGGGRESAQMDTSQLDGPTSTTGQPRA